MSSNSYWAQEEALARYAANGDVVGIRRLLRAGVPVNGAAGNTAFCWALKKGHFDIVETMLSKGVDIHNLIGANRGTALHLACAAGKMSTVKLCLTRGADIDKADANGCTPLQYACKNERAEIAKWLISSGANIYLGNKDQQTAFHYACASGMVSIVELLLTRGASMGQVDKDGCSALHYASKNGKVAMAQFLILNGMDIRLTNQDGQSAFHYACVYGMVSTAELLLSHGAVIDQVDKNDWTPLHSACHNEKPNMADWLIGKGANVTIRNKVSRTALRYACDSGMVSTVELLLTHGACTVVNQVDEDGCTALHSACKTGRIKIASLLIQMGGANVTIRNQDGRSALHEVCAFTAPVKVQTGRMFEKADAVNGNGMVSIAELLLANGAQIDQVDKDGCTPLHHACKNAKVELADCLINKGANVVHRNQGNQDGKTVLHYACEFGMVTTLELLLARGASVREADKDAKEGYSLLQLSLRCKKVKMAELLIRSGAYATTNNQNGWTAMHDICSGSGTVAIAELLVAYGTGIDHVDKDGCTPLHYACRTRKVDIAEWLINKGAVASCRDKAWRTAFHYACESGMVSTVELMMGLGADIDRADKDGWSPLRLACKNGSARIAELLIGNGANATLRHRDGSTAMHDVCSGSGAVSIAELLAANGTGLDQVDKDGCTPLHYACKNGKREISNWLINNGVDTNRKNQAWKTPFHFACESGMVSTAELLLSHGATIDQVDKDGCSPLLMACKNGKVELAEFLIRKGADPTHRDKDGTTILHVGNASIVKMLLACGRVILDQIDKDGCTPLLCACKGEDLKKAALLTDKGADVTISDKNGRTGLHLGSVAIIRLLLANGAVAVIDQRDKNGWSALHFACKAGAMKKATLLIDSGADTNLKDKDGKLATEYLENEAHKQSLQAICNPPNRARALSEICNIESHMSNSAEIQAALREELDVTRSQRDNAIHEVEMMREQLKEVHQNYDAALHALKESGNQRDEPVREVETIIKELELCISQRDDRLGILEKELEIFKTQRDAATLQANADLAELTEQRDEALCTVERIRGELKEAVDSGKYLLLENNNLTIELEAEINRREKAEAALLSTQSSVAHCLTDTEPLLHLGHCCNRVPDVTVEQAIFGGGANGNNALIGCMLSFTCNEPFVRSIMNQQTTSVSILPARGQLSVEYALAVRLYTFESGEVKIYNAINTPFHATNRPLESLQKQLPYTRLLIRALRELGRINGFVENTTVYRCVSIANNAYLQSLYYNYTTNSPQNRLAVGNVMRFPTFTSTSRMEITEFGKDILYEIHLQAGPAHCIGVDIAALSYHGFEHEVLLIPPSCFRITNISNDNGRLRVVLESVDNEGFEYLSK